MKLFINDVESELTIIDKIALSLGFITLLVMVIAFVTYTLPIALPFILVATVVVYSMFRKTKSTLDETATSIKNLDETPTNVKIHTGT